MSPEHFAINDTLRELAKSVEFGPEVAAYLAPRGWCFLFEFPFGSLAFLKNNIDLGNHEIIEAEMCAFIRNRSKRTEHILCHRFSDRATIFRNAFRAHDSGVYSLCIPSFLTQIDGLGCKILKVNQDFFNHATRRKKLKQVRAAILGQPNELLRCTPPIFLETLFKFLSEELNVEIHTGKRNRRQIDDPTYCPLNRHGILHGLDTTYESEGNSLRCIALLDCLLDLDGLLNHSPI